MSTLYDTDFRLWLAEQATLLHTQHVDKLDHENLAEEIQSLFAREDNELEDEIEELNTRMSDWIGRVDNTPEAYCRISELRGFIFTRLEMSPSLNPRAAIYFQKVASSGKRLTRDELIERSLDLDITNMAQEKDNVGSLTTIEVRCSKVTPDAPGKTMDLQQIIQRAVEVFEGEKAALDWLQSPNSALGGCSPISTLNTEVGKLEVANTLGRIEHGVFK